MINGSHQNISIEATSTDLNTSTRCTIENEEGTWNTSPATKVNIHRDGNPMKIACENQKQSGETFVYPKFERAFLFLDIYIDACIISCVVDGITNAFYTYPELVSIQMQAK